MTAYLCPVFQEPQFTDNTEFLAGGLLWFYEAGTNTPIMPYTTEAGDVPYSNPIVLDSRGAAGITIWLEAGQAYRIVLEEKPYYGQTHGTVITEHDNITGINDPSVGTSDVNWVLFDGIPTYISGTSFSVSGDQRSIFTEFRRLFTTNTGGIVYSSIVSATYASGVTTIVVTNDSGNMDAGLNSVHYAFVDPIALPNTYDNLNLTQINGGDNPWTDANNTFGTGIDLDTPYSCVFANGLIMVRGSHQFEFGVGDTYKSYTFNYGNPFPNISFPPYVTIMGAAGASSKSVTMGVQVYDSSSVTIDVYLTPTLSSGGPLYVWANILTMGY